MPIVSIILPAYNAECTIKESIQSIVNQTFRDWELIVINDGSSDNTEKVIQSFQDPRIIYVRNECNKGLIYTLNRGLDMANGKYIARMDADDISLPNRIEKQVQFMDSRRDVIISGTQIELFGNERKKYPKRKLPTRDKDLKNLLAVTSCFAHPTIIIRKSVLRDNNIHYDYHFKDAEDYNMWIDLMPYGKFANLDEILLRYRISNSQITRPSNKQQIKSSILCKKKYLSQYLSKDMINRIFEIPIDISTIKCLKQSINNPKVIEACYLSLGNLAGIYGMAPMALMNAMLIT